MAVGSGGARRADGGDAADASTDSTDDVSSGDAPRSRFRLTIHDPDGAVWRRGARLAVAVPIVLGVCLSVGAKQEAAFAVFGCVGALGMADFGGPRPRRAVAYLELTAVGAIYVALGTLCSQNLVAAVIGMAAITFVTRMAGVFGGYAAAGNISALLAFVLAVMTPGGPAAIVGRELGWIGGGVFAMAVAMLLFPRDEKRALAHQAATACRAVASTLRRHMGIARFDEPVTPDAGGDTSDDLQAIRDLRVQLVKTPYKPAGPGRHDQVMLHTLDLLERAYPFTARARVVTPELPEERALAEQTATAFDECAQMLDESLGKTSVTVDVEALFEARDAHRSAIFEWARRLVGAGEVNDETIETMNAAFPLRVVGGIAEQLGALLDSCVPGAGARSADVPFVPPTTHLDHHLPPMPAPAGAASWFSRATRILASHLHWRSAWFRSSVRGAIAIGASVAIAQLLGIDHAFWIVLGTLSVLRSNVLTTGSTAFQAVLGTFIGFLLATLFMWGFGGNTVALWLALPVLAFLSMWLAGAVGLMAGQAGFALLVVVLFNIIIPTGWQTGLQRLETVAIGAAVSIVAGLLFWPRGAEAVLRSDVAAWYRAARDHCALVVGHLLGRDISTERDASSLRVAQAQARAEEAFDEYLNERGTKHEPWASWGPVLRMPAAIAYGAYTIDQRLGDSASAVAPGCHAAEQAVELVSDRLTTALTLEAEILEHPGDASLGTLTREFGTAASGGEPLFLRPPTPTSILLADVSSTHLVPCLVASVDDDDAYARAFVLLWSSNWLTYLLHASARMPAPLAEVTASADRSWLR